MRRAPGRPPGSELSLVVLGGTSALCAVLAVVAAVGAGALLDAPGTAWTGAAVLASVTGRAVARGRGHRWSEVGPGASWALLTSTLVAAVLLIVAVVSIGDALQ